MINRIEFEFDQFIEKTFPNEEIKKYLLSHERKKLCIERIAAEINNIERQLHSITFDVHKYRVLIDSMAGLFCKVALNHAEESAISQAEKARRVSEANYLKEAEAEMEDLAKDLYKPETSYLNDAHRGKDEAK
jgi:hypothetical protein